MFAHAEPIAFDEAGFVVLEVVDDPADVARIERLAEHVDATLEAMRENLAGTLLLADAAERRANADPAEAGGDDVWTFLLEAVDTVFASSRSALHAAMASAHVQVRAMIAAARGSSDRRPANLRPGDRRLALAPARHLPSAADLVRGVREPMVGALRARRSRAWTEPDVHGAESVLGASVANHDPAEVNALFWSETLAPHVRRRRPRRGIR